MAVEQSIFTSSFATPLGYASKLLSVNRSF
nr:MAG TPA: hypothetical protein [Caudoviricetes sp.]